MSHIEFTGVAGVGKSSVHSELVKTDFLYGGKDEDCFARTSSHLDSLLQKTPQSLEQRIETVIWRFFSTYHYKEFLNSNVEFKKSWDENISDIVKDDRTGLEKLMKDSVAKYRYGISTMRPSEKLCIDEGFYHRAASIGVRASDMGGYSLPGDWYFDVVPEPDMLILVNAADDIIQDRKFKRDGSRYSTENLKKIRRLINQVCEEAQNRGIQVVEIINEDGIEKISSELLDKISDTV